MMYVLSVFDILRFVCVCVLFVCFVCWMCVCVWWWGVCASVFSDRRVWWCIFREEEERIREEEERKKKWEEQWKKEEEERKKKWEEEEEKRKKEEEANKKSSTVSSIKKELHGQNVKIPKDIQIFINKPYDKKEYYKLMRKYHPDKKLFDEEVVTLFTKLINNHKPLADITHDESWQK